VAIFSAETGFFDSGMVFVTGGGRTGAKGLTDPTEFASYIHEHGYGMGTQNYVNDLVNVIGNVLSRLNCP
jgi:hypothetical protein